MITRKTIEFNTPPLSLNWIGDHLIDWINGGSLYSLNGEFKHSNRTYGFKFDAAIQSDNGIYSVIYEKLGTKGLLLKNGEIIREINRSYYQADAYEFPLAFVKLKSNEYALIHCPDKYNQIEIDSIESGKRLTAIDNREVADCFHSRFRVNKANTSLINAGWVWHPVGILKIYNIEKALIDNVILDSPKSNYPINTEVSSAEFLDNDLIVISSSDEEPFDDEDLNDKVNLNPKQLGLYSIEQNKFLKKIDVDYKTGTIIPIDENHVLDLYEYPKLIDLNTGAILQEFKDVNSGNQDMAIVGKVPPIAIDRENRRIAIGNGNKIEVLIIK